MEDKKYLVIVYKQGFQTIHEMTSKQMVNVAINKLASHEFKVETKFGLLVIENFENIVEFNFVTMNEEPNFLRTDNISISYTPPLDFK